MAGRARRRRPAGLVARDTLRLEMGYPLYGQELSRERTPDRGRACAGPATSRAGASSAPTSCAARPRRARPSGSAIFRLTEPGIPRAGQEVLVGRPPGRPRHQRHPLAVARRRHRHGLRARRRRRRPTTTSSSTCAASPRPPAPPAARWWRHPRRNEESRGPPTRATPPTCATTPSTTGCGPRATRPSSASPGTRRTPWARSSTTTRPRWARPSSKDAPYGELESVKAVSDIIAPASGEVIAVNPAVRRPPRGGQRGPLRRGLARPGAAVRPGRARRPDGRARLPRLPGRACEPLHLAHRRRPAGDARGDRRRRRSTSSSPASPRACASDRPLDLPAGLSEQEVLAHLRGAGGAQRLGRGRDHLPRAPGCTTTTSRR